MKKTFTFLCMASAITANLMAEKIVYELPVTASVNNVEVGTETLLMAVEDGKLTMVGTDSVFFTLESNVTEALDGTMTIAAETERVFSNGDIAIVAATADGGNISAMDFIGTKVLATTAVFGYYRAETTTQYSYAAASGASLTPSTRQLKEYKANDEFFKSPIKFVMTSNGWTGTSEVVSSVTFTYDAVKDSLYLTQADTLTCKLPCTFFNNRMTIEGMSQTNWIGEDEAAQAVSLVIIGQSNRGDHGNIVIDLKCDTVMQLVTPMAFGFTNYEDFSSLDYTAQAGRYAVRGEENAFTYCAPAEEAADNGDETDSSLELLAGTYTVAGSKVNWLTDEDYSDATVSLTFTYTDGILYLSKVSAGDGFAAEPNNVCAINKIGQLVIRAVNAETLASPSAGLYDIESYSYVNTLAEVSDDQIVFVTDYAVSFSEGMSEIDVHAESVADKVVEEDARLAVLAGTYTAEGSVTNYLTDVYGDAATVSLTFTYQNGKLLLSKVSAGEGYEAEPNNVCVINSEGNLVIRAVLDETMEGPQAGLYDMSVANYVNATAEIQDGKLVMTSGLDVSCAGGMQEIAIAAGKVASKSDASGISVLTAGEKTNLSYDLNGRQKFGKGLKVCNGKVVLIK